MNLYCLHGFLGLPSDWNFLQLNETRIDNLIAINLYDSASLPFDRWAIKFNQWVRQKSTSQKNCLLGYSMGGRLALHALIQNPELYSAAIILSTHLGLQNSQEKLQRLQQDAALANQFLNEPWESILKKWNDQPVFKNSQHVIQRQEREYSRSALADCLQVWSLGNQTFLKDHIDKLTIPILWCTGEYDTKYREIARSLKKKSNLNLKVISNASHRVFFDNPKETNNDICLYLNNFI